MGDWIARLVQGNVAEVKVVLTSVEFALAAYHSGSPRPARRRSATTAAGGVEQRDDSGSGRSGGDDDDDR